MTNYEKIKNMSINEMAQSNLDFFACPYGQPYYDCEMGKHLDDDCIACTKQWLESECDEL